MALGLLGKKVGMTRLFDEQGRMRSVTVIEVGPCVVLRHRLPESDGYRALQLGFDVVAPERITKPMRGVFQVLGTDAFRHVAEFRVGADVELPEPGSAMTVDLFEPGSKVNIRGRSKGRGFAGVHKRHGHSGGRASHGSGFHRAPGSIGQATQPSRVFPGVKLPGQYGNKFRTIRNLEVIQVIPEDNLLLVEGGVPGARGSLLRIVQA